MLFKKRKGYPFNGDAKNDFLVIEELLYNLLNYFFIFFLVLKWPSNAHTYDKYQSCMLVCILLVRFQIVLKQKLKCNF